MDAVIISRHPATVAFIFAAAKLPTDTPVITGNATPADVAGKVVYGNVPLSLACAAVAVVAVEFTGTPPRGAEYTLTQMEEAGARLTTYRVQAPQYVEVGPHERITGAGRTYSTAPTGGGRAAIGCDHHGPASHRDSND